MPGSPTATATPPSAVPTQPGLSPDVAMLVAAPERFGLRIVGDELWLEDVSLASLAARFGTPTYALGIGAVRARYLALRAALTGVDHQICYAVKANGALPLLGALAELGAGADIVSGGELRRAQLAGIAGARIVFSGVGKLDGELDAAIGAGVASINVESEQELARVAARARALGVRAPVSVRVNPDIDPQTHPYLATGLRDAKFGVDMTRAAALLAQAHADDALEALGFACHIGSQIEDAAPFVQSVERIAGLISSLRADGLAVTQLDLGGGLAIPYAPGEPELDVAAWGRAVSAAVAPLGVRLVLEPGRWLVGNAGVLLTRVIGTKQGSERDFVIVDAAMNDLIRPALYEAYHGVVPVAGWAAVAEGSAPGPGPRLVDVVGPVCECGDFLAQARAVDWPQPGALWAVLSAGAYGSAMSSSYNTRPPAAELVVDGERVCVARPRPSLDELLEPELRAWRATR